MPSGFASAPTVFVFSMTLSKRFALCFCQTRTRSASAPVISRSSISTTSIRAPSVEYTVAISSPMIPPPITSIRFGTACSSSAPVESTTRGSSGMNGSFTACEPAAMMAFANRTTVFSPVGAWPGPDVNCTSRWFGPTKRPTPRTVVTLRVFAMPLRPPVSLPTTLALCARSLPRSIFGAPNSTPSAAKCAASSITAATCSSAFDGMQPTFRHTPPSVG